MRWPFAAVTKPESAEASLRVPVLAEALPWAGPDRMRSCSVPLTPATGRAAR